MRKYSGLPDLIWGNQECEHQWQTEATDREYHQTGATGRGSLTTTIHRAISSSGFCSLCGAWKGAYGLEPTPEMYVLHTIEILREIRRVLRKDGVVFWNIGDSYATSPAGNKTPSGVQQQSKKRLGKLDEYNSIPLWRESGLKPKDLCLIPFRVAIAAQADGWWVRSVIIWNKPNPMPESCRDRPTESHEYILMLTKSSRYFWDAEAVREKARPETWGVTKNGDYFGQDIKDYASSGVQSPSDIKRRIGARVRGMKTKGEVELLRQEQHHGQDIIDGIGRNLRSVWSFPTQPYPEAHFATYPEKLVEICVKAATPEIGCCSKCGAPWVRIVDAKRTPDKPRPKDALNEDRNTKGERWITQTFTLGWQPQCQCNADKVPSIVLDPFAGSGTTLKVAAELNRRAIGYELSEQYCGLAVERNKQAVLI